MLDLNKKVKEIRIYKNAIMYNSHQDRNYRLNKYLEIEFFDGYIIELDVDAGSDITDCDYLKIIDKGKLEKSIFKINLIK